MRIEKVIIWIDGASRGNPGPASIAAVIKDEQNRPVNSFARRIGVTTNNQAEYRALIAALEKAISLGARQILVNSDSELVIKQLNGGYRIKNVNLKPMYEKVLKLQNSLEQFTIKHIPREQNREADSLANRALDALD